MATATLTNPHAYSQPETPPATWRDVLLSAHGLVQSIHDLAPLVAALDPKQPDGIDSVLNRVRIQRAVIHIITDIARYYDDYAFGERVVTEKGQWTADLIGREIMQITTRTRILLHVCRSGIQGTAYPPLDLYYPDTLRAAYNDLAAAATDLGEAAEAEAAR